MPRKIVNKVGLIGETVAEKFFINKGFEVIEKNYNKYCGEIDLIVLKGNKHHFVEVKTISRVTSKSVSCETLLDQYKGFFEIESFKEVIHETSYRPEINVTREKLYKLSRTALLFIEERGLGDIDWQMDSLGIVLYKGHLKDSFRAKIEYLECIY